MKNRYPHPIRSATVTISASLLIIFTAGFTGAAEGGCTELLQTRCEKCHYVTRVCQKVKQDMTGKSWFGSSASSWKRTIKNMVRQGAKLNSDEQRQLVDCLSEPSPNILDFCKLGE